MQFSRGLTSPERWDIGLLLALLIVTCLCLGVLWNYQAIPTLWAQDRQTNADVLPHSVKTSTRPMQAPAPLVLQRISVPIIAPPPALVPVAAAPAAPSALPRPAVVKPQKSIVYHWFDGQKYRYWKTLRMHVTAYAPDRRCCWPFDGTTTASGASVKTNEGKLVAADTRVLPMYALVSVPGYHRGEPVPVLDRGGAIKGRRLDVLLPTFDAAEHWGTKDIEVKVYLPVDN